MSPGFEEPLGCGGWMRRRKEPFTFCSPPHPAPAAEGLLKPRGHALLPHQSLSTNLSSLFSHLLAVLGLRQEDSASVLLPSSSRPSSAAVREVLRSLSLLDPPHFYQKD